MISFYFVFKKQERGSLSFCTKYQGYKIMEHLQKKTEYVLLEKERVIEKID